MTPPKNIIWLACLCIYIIPAAPSLPAATNSSIFQDGADPLPLGEALDVHIEIANDGSILGDMHFITKQTFIDIQAKNITKGTWCSYVLNRNSLETFYKQPLGEQSAYQLCMFMEMFDRHMTDKGITPRGTFISLPNFLKWAKPKIQSFTGNINAVTNSTHFHNVKKHIAKHEAYNKSNHTLTKMMAPFKPKPDLENQRHARKVLTSVNKVMDYMYEKLAMDESPMRHTPPHETVDRLSTGLIASFDRIGNLKTDIDTRWQVRNTTQPAREKMKMYFADASGKPAYIRLRHHPIRQFIPSTDTGRRAYSISHNLRLYVAYAMTHRQIPTREGFRKLKEMGVHKDLSILKDANLALIPDIGDPFVFFGMQFVLDLALNWISCWQTRGRFCIDDCSCYALPKLDPVFELPTLEVTYEKVVDTFFDVNVPMDYCKLYDTMNAFVEVKDTNVQLKTIGTLKMTAISVINMVQLGVHVMKAEKTVDDMFGFIGLPANIVDLFKPGHNTDPAKITTPGDIHFNSELACFAKNGGPAARVAIFLFFIPLMIFLLFMCAIPCMCRDCIYCCCHEGLFAFYSLKDDILQRKRKGRPIDQMFAETKSKQNPIGFRIQDTLWNIFARDEDHMMFLLDLTTPNNTAEEVYEKPQNQFLSKWIFSINKNAAPPFVLLTDPAGTPLPRHSNYSHFQLRIQKDE
jgi:hypothetical protein